MPFDVRTTHIFLLFHPTPLLILSLHQTHNFLNSSLSLLPFSPTLYVRPSLPPLLLFGPVKDTPLAPSPHPLHGSERSSKVRNGPVGDPDWAKGGSYGQARGEVMQSQTLPRGTHNVYVYYTHTSPFHARTYSTVYTLRDPIG